MLWNGNKVQDVCVLVNMGRGPKSALELLLKIELYMGHGGHSFSDTSHRNGVKWLSCWRNVGQWQHGPVWGCVNTRFIYSHGDSPKCRIHCKYFSVIPYGYTVWRSLNWSRNISSQSVVKEDKASVIFLFLLDWQPIDQTTYPAASQVWAVFTVLRRLHYRLFWRLIDL